MRHPQLGVAALAVIGAILAVVGILAIAMAPQIMNHAEIDTLRIIGGVAAGLGVVLLGLGMRKK